jgi:hypothetical protein
MSNKNRINPDYYRQAGRDAQGETLNQGLQKQLLARERASRPAATSGNFIPGGDRAPAPVAVHAAAPGRRRPAPLSRPPASQAARAADGKGAGTKRARRPARRARKPTRSTRAARGQTTARRRSRRRARGASPKA